MTSIKIIFGTESGGSEVTAEDIAESLSAQHEDTVENMCDVSVENLDPSVLYLVVCSSHGEGELPSSAVPFYEALQSQRPSLSGSRFGLYGRGDVSYLKSFLGGPNTIDETLRQLGAERIGEYGQHDSSDWDADEDAPIEWANGIVTVYENEVVVS